MKIASSSEEVIVRGLVHAPKILAELRGFEVSWFAEVPCRLIFAAAVQSHRRMALDGKVRYATRRMIEAEVDEIVEGKVARNPKDMTRRKAESLKQAVARLLDESQAASKPTIHEFREAADAVREYAMDEESRRGVIEIVERLQKQGAKGLASDLRDLSAKLSSFGARESAVGLLSEEASEVLADYYKIKADPGAGRIPTLYPRLNRVTSGGGKVGRMWMVAGYAKDGKAGSITCPVLTSTGWRKLGDLKVGDRVVNPEGGTARVIGVFPQGVKPLFKVTFSDGSSTECCDEHLWHVNTAQRMARGMPPRVMPLKEIRRRKNRYFIPLVRNVELATYGAYRPLDPYLLGAMLGNGHFGKQIQFSTGDAEMVQSIRNALPANTEMVFSERYDYRFRRVARGQSSGLADAVNKLGLRGKLAADKFVPHAYLWAPLAVRLAVLQGLMDTDGSVTRTGAGEFSTVSDQLAADVLFLARSLGCVARDTTRTTTYTYKGKKLKGQVSHRVLVSAPSWVPLFRLSRKAKRAGFKSRTPRRGIAKIEPMGDVEQVCIALDSDNQLYAVNDFIVTHNTQMGKELVYAASTHGEGCLIVTGEQNRSDIRTMMMIRHSHQFLTGGLSYAKYANGTLSKSEEAVLEKTAKDISGGSMGPVSYYQAPGGTTVSDVRALVDAVSRKHPVTTLMLDHTMLFQPSERGHGMMMENTRVSEVIREMKQLALDGANGKGLWVIACHQISRDGWEAAIKRGFYLARDLAGSAEAERSADLVMWLLRDDALKDVNEVRVGVALDRYGAGDVRGWQMYERYSHAAILPIEGEGGVL